MSPQVTRPEQQATSETTSRSNLCERLTELNSARNAPKPRKNAAQVSVGMMEAGSCKELAARFGRSRGEMPYLVGVRRRQHPLLPLAVRVRLLIAKS